MVFGTGGFYEGEWAEGIKNGKVYTYLKMEANMMDFGLKIVEMEKENRIL